MAQQVAKRMYRMTDADLKQTADALKNRIKRDLTDFASRNITETSLETLHELNEAFDVSSTDKEMLGFKMKATEEKDVVAEAVRLAIRPIRHMAELAYKGKGLYHVFGFEDMATLGDSDLCLLGKRVTRVATRLKVDLVPRGLADAQLVGLANICQQLDTAIDKSAAEIELRDIETQERVNRGNALYEEVMRLASIGKSIYADKDEARYNDYVLIGSRGSEQNGNSALPPDTATQATL